MNEKSTLAQFRMPTLEDDISLNHDSQEPFNNFPSPSEIPIEDFQTGELLTETLLGGKPLSYYIARDKFPIPDPSDREG